MIQVRADVMNEDCIAIAVSLSSKASASWLGSTCMYLILCEAMSVAQLDIQPVHGANEGGVSSYCFLIFRCLILRRHAGHLRVMIKASRVHTCAAVFTGPLTHIPRAC